MEFTAAKLVEICAKDGLYRTPHVNDKLYLHYQGFKEIDGSVMEKYTGLKCLWLQGNGLTKLQGLDELTELRTLCVHENVLEEIEGLGNLAKLRNLNASKNFVRNLPRTALAGLKELDTLTLGHNSLGPGTDVLVGLVEVPKIQTLDLQANKLEEGDSLLSLLVENFDDLRCLYLQGNPFIKKMRHYRKRFVSSIETLRYLDDRPVFEDERRRCRAWADTLRETGDLDKANQSERDEIAKIRQEKKAAEDQRLADFDAMIAQAKKKAAEDQIVITVNTSNILTEQKKKEDHYVDPDELD